MDLSVVRWSEADFVANRDAWDILLRNSAADPLFLSWRWQHTWWQTFKHLLSAELFLFAAYNRQHELVGVAPLYRSRSKLRDMMAVERVQFLGSGWRSTAALTMRTEHLDLILRRDVAEAAGMALLREIIVNQRWDEFVLALVKTDSVVLQYLRNNPLTQELYVRRASEPPSYYIDTTGTFSDYLAERGKNTRLQMYNRRKQLEKLPGLRIESRWNGDAGGFFDLLDHLHTMRWGCQAFEPSRLQFNRELATDLSTEGLTHFSIMWLGQRALSVLYNYRVDGQEYYIQSGFDEQFDRKLQLGFLHLGYAIEQAFADERVRRFNLLSGAGKNTSYKERLTSQYDQLVDVQLLRPRVLKFAYSIYDAVFKRNEALAANAMPN